MFPPLVFYTYCPLAESVHHYRLECVSSILLNESSVTIRFMNWRSTTILNVVVHRDGRIREAEFLSVRRVETLSVEKALEVSSVFTAAKF